MRAVLPVAVNGSAGNWCAFRMWEAAVLGLLWQMPTDGWVTIDVFSGCNVIALGLQLHGCLVGCRGVQTLQERVQEQINEASEIPNSQADVVRDTKCEEVSEQGVRHVQLQMHKRI